MGTGWGQSGLHCSLGCQHAPFVGKSYRRLRIDNVWKVLDKCVWSYYERRCQTVANNWSVQKWGLKSFLFLSVAPNAGACLGLPGTAHCKQWVIAAFPPEPCLQKWKGLQTCLVLRYRAAYILEQLLDFRGFFPQSSVSCCKISLKYISVFSWKCIRSSLCPDSYSEKCIFQEKRKYLEDT